MPKFNFTEGSLVWGLIKSSAYATGLLAANLILAWGIGHLAKATGADDVWYNVLNFILWTYTIVSTLGTFGFILIRYFRELKEWAFDSFKKEGADEPQ
jgi:hypothetical protein